MNRVVHIRFIHSWINQSINQSTNRWINRWIHESIHPFFPGAPGDGDVHVAAGAAFAGGAAAAEAGGAPSRPQDHRFLRRRQGYRLCSRVLDRSVTESVV